MSHSPLLGKYLTNLQVLAATKESTVLDLACGNGRNGLYLINHGIPVTFADLKSEALDTVQQALCCLKSDQQALAHFWQVDFEQQAATLPHHAYSAVLVFRYLHRPLFDQIKHAVKPGGMIIYETFTEQQAQFGRPRNPDFLLKANELIETFQGWEVLHSFEGIVDAISENDSPRAISQIVAIKPQ